MRLACLVFSPIYHENVLLLTICKAHLPLKYCNIVASVISRCTVLGRYQLKLSILDSKFFWILLQLGFEPSKCSTLFLQNICHSCLYQNNTLLSNTYRILLRNCGPYTSVINCMSYHVCRVTNFLIYRLVLPSISSAMLLDLYMTVTNGSYLNSVLVYSLRCLAVDNIRVWFG